MKKWYNNFDRVRNVVLVSLSVSDELHELPVKMAVCPTCNGKGSHVKPGIDSHGITDDEFREDPDFREAYFNGLYDVICYECNGNNVVPEIDEYAVRHSKDYQETYEAFIEEAEERRLCAAELAAERRAGA